MSYAGGMSSYLDHLPSHEQAKIRARLRSPEEYERLREKVKGPEDLEQELDRSEQYAEVSFRLETESKLKASLKNRVAQDMREQGIEVLVEGELAPEQRAAIEQGKFSVAVSAHPATHHDQLMILPEGNIQDQIPVQMVFSDRYVSQLADGSV